MFSSSLPEMPFYFLLEIVDIMSRMRLAFSFVLTLRLHGVGLDRIKESACLTRQSFSGPLANEGCGCITTHNLVL